HSRFCSRLPTTGKRALVQPFGCTRSRVGRRRTPASGRAGVKQSQRGCWGRVALVAATVAAVLGTTVAGAGAASGGREQGSAEGVLRLGAEEELACADWISSCAGLSWGNWTLGIETLPQAYRVSPSGDYVPGPILIGEPTVDPGPPAKITYHIKPE